MVVVGQRGLLSTVDVVVGAQVADLNRALTGGGEGALTANSQRVRAGGVGVGVLEGGTGVGLGALVDLELRAVVPGLVLEVIRTSLGDLHLAVLGQDGLGGHTGDVRGGVLRVPGDAGVVIGDEAGDVGEGFLEVDVRIEGGGESHLHLGLTRAGGTGLGQLAQTIRRHRHCEVVVLVSGRTGRHRQGVVGALLQLGLGVDDLDDRVQRGDVGLDAGVELVDHLVALEGGAIGDVDLRDGGGDGVGQGVARAGGRLVLNLLVHTGDRVLGVDVDVVVPLRGFLRVGHRQGDDEVIGRNDLGGGAGLTDEVGADVGLGGVEGGQAIAPGGDRARGGLVLEFSGFGDIALELGQGLPPGVGGEVDVQLGDGELDAGDWLALGRGVLVTGALLDPVGVGLLALVDGERGVGTAIDGGGIGVGRRRRAGRGDERARGERHRDGEAEAPAHGEGVHGCSLLWLWDDIGI